MVNQFTINLGFYMLMPYLAQHLSGSLGMAAWTVGLVLGVRNFSQQGMFFVGGTLADRFGYKPLIVSGLVLRVAGFAVLGLVDTLPALLAASAATGLAGALFNPAVRAYLAQDAGERRVEAFALFNVFYQAGILLGPLIGVLLTGVSFRLTCLVAAAVFAVLSAVQLRALPASGSPAAAPGESVASVLSQWRTVVANRPFLLFSLAMIGSYALSFQVYLALPLEVRRVAGDEGTGTVGVGLLFAASGLATVVGQTRLTAWCRRRLGAGPSLVAGLAALGAAFLPPLAATAAPVPDGGPALWALAVLPPLASALLLALGTMLAYPFEMDTIVALAGNRYVATHYGLYNTICGIGITLGNLLTGAALDAARSAGAPALPWVALTAVGGGCAVAVLALHRGGRLGGPPAARTAAAGGVSRPG
ncbi:MFS transporter [Streptomyces albireticuli]|uniref:MFS transporter n=1 Tax=Streptomyces albireticuli TaxID=1940 RepID=A0A2A2D094_9ACTN|nr:MFS transporter [Streptomyces albireticuli]MCD9145131.1 MFS transporter [Streptomyces albireticuli]MCD9164694.1 MFS transporter [Streptomyces albireticuli]MCD9194959.1 MFS transporter [Streptomyces albireticuli]PAU44760.1 MFS transporter [Streptomyces albireticuli]